MRRFLGSMIVAATAALGMLALPVPVDAECPHFEVPPATDAARSAREVIVGTVIENVEGQLFDFRLRIDHVLRGPAQVGDVRRFEGLYPGWPLAVGVGGKGFAPCEPIPGWMGNVMALSLDAMAPDGKTRYHAASWIKGDLPINRELSRTTLAEMQELASLPMTDTVPASLHHARRSPDWSPILWTVLGSAFVITAARRPVRSMIN